MSNGHGYAQLTGGECLAFAIERQRDDYLAQPEERRAETIARVRRLLNDEARRKQNQPSYLKTHAKQIYGKDL